MKQYTNTNNIVSIVLCCGWGLDSSIWYDMIRYLDTDLIKIEYIDPGYFGTERKMDPYFCGTRISIGHSFGCLKAIELVHSGIASYSIAICGFKSLRTSAKDVDGKYDPVKSGIIANNFKELFLINPSKTLKKFHETCGYIRKHSTVFDYEKLKDDLLSMNNGKTYSLFYEDIMFDLSIESDNDPIIKSNIPSVKSVNISFGHIPMIQAPETCAKILSEAIIKDVITLK